MKADKKRVIVIDDEVSLTRLLKLNLEKTSKYQVCTVNTPQLALRTALEFKPDIILLDVVMPGMDGGYLASQLRQHPELKSVPIVFLTAVATKSEVAAHQGVIGGSAFVAKPADLIEIMARLDSELAFTPGADARVG
jgi:DNA-binding response OmpR family regulator